MAHAVTLALSRFTGDVPPRMWPGHRQCGV